MECLFCQIVRGTIESRAVAEGNSWYAFEDLHPQAPHHILVIPRRHVTTVDDFTDSDCTLAGELLLAAAQIARNLGFSDDGYRLVFNCRAHGGQSVDHVHLHLLGGRALRWPPG